MIVMAAADEAELLHMVARRPHMTKARSRFAIRAARGRVWICRSAASP